MASDDNEGALDCDVSVSGVTGKVEVECFESELWVLILPSLLVESATFLRLLVRLFLASILLDIVFGEFHIV